MAKYMVFYNAPVKARELMANSSPEQMKASMEEWIHWRDEAAKTMKVDFGMPMQATDHITPDAVTPSDSQITGYMMIEGDSKEAVVELLKTHPHLKRPDASIDLLEILSMPGLEA